MNRGEIWWAPLPVPKGSGPGFRRPVLIVSADSFNRSRLATVIVATITTNERLAAAPGNVRIGGRRSGLSQPSVVNVSQLLTVDRKFLESRAGRLDASQLETVDRGLRLALGLV
ncbi:MAG TPA: type II toxin-antitoxin system PemK/MazF family toxin [Steroidobacteraceae bacterium]|nr:type II toxin-antitoxin system PemK/MazF family toxin [Steroidobacteraceae bacterium]HQR49749.1 type II toxin-antitoxin system PemK/MazF family toxin [Steroidobacteraceae bacterium]